MYKYRGLQQFEEDIFDVTQPIENSHIEGIHVVRLVKVLLKTEDWIRFQRDMKGITDWMSTDSSQNAAIQVWVAPNGAAVQITQVINDRVGDTQAAPTR